MVATTFEAVMGRLMAHPRAAARTNLAPRRR